MKACRIHSLFLLAAFTAVAACGEVQNPNNNDGVDADPGMQTDGGVGDPDAMVDPGDVDPPDTILDDVPASLVNTSSATISFHATESNCTFMCRQGDSGSFSSCTSPVTVDAVADGPQMFSVYAVDAADNADPTPASHSWVVDTVAPVVTISSGPNNPTADSSGEFTFSANETSTFQCVIDGTAQACSSPFTQSGFADGNHTFKVNATDAAGNTGNATWAWVVDAAAPSIVINSAPPLWTSSQNASFGFTAEAGATVECSLDSSTAYGACDSATTKSYTNLGANTAHTFRVRATDGAGNKGVASYTWNIDTIAPVVTILNKPNDPTNQDSASFTFNISESASLVCSLNGSNGACDSSSSMDYVSVPANQDDTFKVTATDLAGNVGSASYTWTVDTQPPDTTIGGAPSGTYPIDYATLTLSSNDPNATFRCQINGGSVSPCTSPLALSNLGYGTTVKVSAWAVDPLQNVDPTPATASWTNKRGLILYYKLDGSAKNASPLGAVHDGTESSVGYTTGYIGKAALFQGGSSSYIKLADTATPMSNDDAYTISLWVDEYKPQTDTQQRFLFNFFGSAGGIEVYRQNSLKNELYIAIKTETGKTNSTSFQFAPLKFTNLIFEYPGLGKDITVYQNDVKVATVRNPDGKNVFAAKQLSSMLLGQNSLFIIDDVRVYNTTYNSAVKCTDILGGTWDYVKGVCNL